MTSHLTSSPALRVRPPRDAHEATPFEFMHEIVRARRDASRSSVALDAFAAIVARLFDDHEVRSALAARVATVAGASTDARLEEPRRRVAFAFYVKTLAAALARSDVGEAAAHVTTGDWSRAAAIVEEAHARAPHRQLDELAFALDALATAADARVAAAEADGVLDEVAISFEGQAWSWPTASLRSRRDEALRVLDHLVALR